jgi:hypothetical protein
MLLEAMESALNRPRRPDDSYQNETDRLVEYRAGLARQRLTVIDFAGWEIWP